ncbi:MAG: DNA polymerase III subunit delta', partial [Chloroflexi bacterium]|nr:DNA polymerase III subunit delta' [Chloroflexota bacterium]
MVAKPPRWSVVGHEWAVDLLAKGLDSGRLSHAYLFVGPPQIGKTTLAASFAQALLCTGAPAPCGECTACQKVLRGSHPDLRMIQPGYGSEEPAAKAPKSLGIEAIRALQHEAALKPFEGLWKIFIIPDAQLMTPPAQDGLLKTLEEPPSYVILLLTALDPSALLPTIVSRCQVFNLRPLSTERIREALIDRWAMERERAEVLAALADGRMGIVVEAASDEESVPARSEQLDELLTLARASRAERLVQAESLARQEEIEKILGLWASWWRDLLLVKAGVPQAVQNIDRRSELEKEARGYELAEIEGALASLNRTLERLEKNVNPRLALEVLLLEMPF